MLRRAFLALAVALSYAPAVFAQAPEKWEAEISAFEKKDAAHPPPPHAILFIGSSSIRLWTEVAKDFPEHQVINRGFGGSVISDSVAFVDRIVLPYAPRFIVFYAGGNDINAGKSPATVAADFRAFAEKVHAKLPETDIAFISIAPNPKRWAQIEKVRAANAAIREYCQSTPHLKYIDVHPGMLGPDGQPKQGIYRDDGLHMNLEGYKIWTEIVRPFLPPPDKSAAEKSN